MSSLSFQGVLLDIEGTTTPIAFVYDVLFPYARAGMDDYVRSRWGTPLLISIIKALRAQQEEDALAGLNPPGMSTSTQALPHVQPDNPVERAVEYLLWLMDHDRKVAPLKTVQGRIWEDGYRTGVLKGQLFPDVPPFLKTCRERSVAVRIFSSGSALSQKLLFGYSEAGDLKPLLAGYHDTAVGPKIDSESYARIVTEWSLPPASIVFVSDVVAELDAAAAAGLATRLCLRPGNAPQPPSTHSPIQSLEELLPQQ